MPTAEELFTNRTAAEMIEALRSAEPSREVTHLQEAADELQGKSLRERSDHLRDALLADVPGGYWTLAGLIRGAAEESEVFSGWMIWPVTSAVALRAAEDGSTEAFEDGLALLAALTHRLTSEFAIRTLLRQDTWRALEMIRGWTGSADEHVRRLASEGTRPYLPWGLRVPVLASEPGATLSILDALYQDESEYVRRSVANHLNDLSRDHPELVVETARRWLDSAVPTTPWVVRHGLRTLVKKGHPEALELLGFGPSLVEVLSLEVLRDEVPWAGTLSFSAVLHNAGAEPARIAVDYVLGFRRANGSLSEKTFKLTTTTLPAGESLRVERRHSFRPISTRRYYPGMHSVALQVNGAKTAPAPFELLGTPSQPEEPSPAGS